MPSFECLAVMVHAHFRMYLQIPMHASLATSIDLPILLCGSCYISTDGEHDAHHRKQLRTRNPYLRYVVVCGNRCVLLRAHVLYP